MARKADGKLWLYPNSGIGEFSEDTKQEVYVFPDPETGTATDPAKIRQIVSVGDITPDSESYNPDFVAVIGDQLWFLPGYSGGTIESGYPIGNSGWGKMTLASPGDLDGDGFVDLIARDTVSGDVWVYHGRSRGDADGDGVADGGTDPARWASLLPHGLRHRLEHHRAPADHGDGRRQRGRHPGHVDHHGQCHGRAGVHAGSPHRPDRRPPGRRHRRLAGGRGDLLTR